MSSNSAYGWPPRPPAASLLTGAPMSSRSNHRPATPPGCGAGLLGMEPGVNPPFEMDNRSKRSVVLDLGTDEGRQIAIELLSSADAFVTNVRPAALQRLGLDFEALAARNPRLVYGLLTGYGMTGPEANRPAYDVAAFWARAGLADLLTRTGDTPPFQRGGMGDHSAGMTLAAAVCAALVARDRTGTGQLVTHIALSAGHLHRELRPEHAADERAFDCHRAARDDGQPVHEQLCDGRGTTVLDRRTGE